MSTSYRAVSWNANKRRYDAVAGAAIVGFLVASLGAQAVWDSTLTVETVMIRALGATAFALLHVILAIGPLSRLDRRFLPLLYNRRHLGVMMFTVALAHAVFATVQFHSFGTLHPLVSVLISNGRYTSLAEFPFQPLGMGALVILFLMAATSHDFWLRNLTAPVWKTLHTGVYVAYALIALHVMFGVMQGETTGLAGWALAAGVMTIGALHVVAAYREAALDREAVARAEGFVDVCAVDEIPEQRAVIACLAGERVAVFRYDGRVSALSNVCQHQNGPLGEGRIRKGCVVCPWHGYEYLPDTGASPAPFTEKVPTFMVRIAEGRVLVRPQPLPPGTRVEPAVIPDAHGASRASGT